MIADSFDSGRRALHLEGRAVQIVSFSDVESRFPAYLAAMESAGFEDVDSAELGERQLRRRLASRMWYAKLEGDVGASTDFLLVHRIRR